MSTKTRKVDEEYMVCDGCDQEIPKEAVRDRDYFVVQVRLIPGSPSAAGLKGMERYQAQVADGTIKWVHMHTDCISKVPAKVFLSVFDNVEVDG